MYHIITAFFMFFSSSSSSFCCITVIIVVEDLELWGWCEPWSKLHFQHSEEELMLLSLLFAALESMAESEEGPLGFGELGFRDEARVSRSSSAAASDRTAAALSANENKS